MPLWSLGLIHHLDDLIFSQMAKRLIVPGLSIFWIACTGKFFPVISIYGSHEVFVKTHYIFFIQKKAFGQRF
jgi:hypothetical protein